MAAKKPIPKKNLRLPGGGGDMGGGASLGGSKVTVRAGSVQKTPLTYAQKAQNKSAASYITKSAPKGNSNIKNYWPDQMLKATEGGFKAGRKSGLKSGLKTGAKASVASAVAGYVVGKQDSKTTNKKNISKPKGQVAGPKSKRGN